MLLLKENTRFIFQGDSVTDCGRALPVAARWDELGTGYASAAASLLDAAYPQLHLRPVNMGISGNTSADLLARWQTDTLDLAPDWVSVMIGANDVWRRFDRPWDPAAAVGPQAYRENLTAIVQRTLPVVQGMVLMTPFYMPQSADDPMRAAMLEYGAIVKEVAAAHGTLLVDTQAAMDAYFRHYHYSAMSWDGIHPNGAGSMVLARALLNALGFEWNGG